MANNQGRKEPREPEPPPPAEKAPPRENNVEEVKRRKRPTPLVVEVPGAVRRKY